MKNVLIVSHADADGHVIAEQVRRNLSAIPRFNVSTLVDPTRTKDHRLWTNLEVLPEIDSHDIVFFVDLMFAPASFAIEADALVGFASSRPEKLFFVLDHHPLPLRRLFRAPNLHPVYRPDVLDCTFGTPSRLMVLAALLEKQPTRAGALKQPGDDELAVGIRRAAAPGGPLAGNKLLALMRHGCWDALAALGRDDSRLHRLPRGRRAAHSPTPDLLTRLDKLANELLKAPSGASQPGGSAMSYDAETAIDAVAPEPNVVTTDRRDLEAIVTLLELSAILLTQGPDSDFTAQELFAQARDLGGDELSLEETDVKIVLGKAGFLRKGAHGRFRLR